jgi:hypothetical protein
MKQTVSVKSVIVVMLALLFLTAGCKNKSSDMLTVTPENGPTVKAAVSKAEQMLKIGTDVDVILTSLEGQLKADARVYDVELESENSSVSMVFNDGETHTILLIDEENESGDLSSSSSSLAYDPQSAHAGTRSSNALTLQPQDAGQGYYRMPANNQMLLANSLTLFHGNSPKFVVTDSTELIGKMLKARGYEGEPEKEITIDLFKNLTSYGVIVLETHGGGRNLQYPTELFGKANCGGEFSKYKLLTTEVATADKILQYKDDLFCGRVTLYDNLTRRGGRLVVKNQYFGVTANYVREHDKGTFPDNTLMLISSCSAYSDTMSSPLKDMLFEKCNKGARFLSWTGKVSARIAIRAALNLFQLMTASNEELTGKEGYKALEKSTPPQGGEFTALERALGELRSNSYLTDPRNGASLELSKQNTETTDLILMPHPLSISGDSDLWVLDIYCEGQPTATVGETDAALENIGGSGWKLSMPVGAYGDMVIRENGRVSIARPLHRWRPQLKIDTTIINSLFPFLHLNATVTLLARATVDSWCFRESAWIDPPPATFNTYWDIDGSNIAWTIDGSGTQTYDEYSMSYQYTGSGLESCRAAECSGSFYSFDGVTASFQICCSKLPFTVTFKGSDGAGGQDNPDLSFCATIWEDNVIALADDWSVAGGSHQDNISSLDPIQISWNAFSAEPPFDQEKEPR